MDKFDFYKELMSEYSFDKAKIYENAKKGRLSVRKKSRPVYIGMTAAAAVMAVAVGTLMFVFKGNREIEPVSEGALTILSDGESVEKSAKNIPENESSGPISDKSGTAGGNSSAEERSSYTEKISLPESSGDTSSQTSEPVSLPGEKYEAVNSITEADNIPEPQYPDVETAELPDISDRLPDGVELPFDAEAASVSTGNIRAQNAYFLNNDTLYVKTKKDIRLYEVSENGAALKTPAQACPDAKVFWVSENGGSLLAADSDNKIYYVDADNGTIRDLETVNTIGYSEIVEAAYNEESDLLVLNICYDGEYLLYAADFSEYQAGEAEASYRSKERFNLLAADGKTVYFSDYSLTTLNVHKVTAGRSDLQQVTSLEGRFDISPNCAFTHAVLNTDSGVTRIFDPETESLIDMSDCGNILFGASAHSFYSEKDECCYTVRSGKAAESGGLGIVSEIDFKRGFSEAYEAVAEDGAVKIIQKAKDENMTFGTLYEDASEELRAAVNAALGLNNALASGKLADCGISDGGTLNATVAACYSEKAAAELKKRCEISESEELTCSGGGLTEISVPNTVLVMDKEGRNSAEGTLYIRAGSFCGMPAYFTRTVNFVKEDGIFKLDCIVE